MPSASRNGASVSLVMPASSPVTRSHAGRRAHADTTNASARNAVTASPNGSSAYRRNGPVSSVRPSTTDHSGPRSRRIGKAISTSIPPTASAERAASICSTVRSAAPAATSGTATTYCASGQAPTGAPSRSWSSVQLVTTPSSRQSTTVCEPWTSRVESVMRTSTQRVPSTSSRSTRSSAAAPATRSAGCARARMSVSRRPAACVPSASARRTARGAARPRVGTHGGRRRRSGRSGSRSAPHRWSPRPRR